jgi:hypothetical protein
MTACEAGIIKLAIAWQVGRWVGGDTAAHIVISKTMIARSSQAVLFAGESSGMEDHIDVPGKIILPVAHTRTPAPSLRDPLQVDPNCPTPN